MNIDYTSIKISADKAVTIAENLYKIHGKISPLPGELDFNFKITTDTTSYLLKISRPDVSAEYIDFQSSILQHIHQQNPDFNYPKSFPDTEGNHISIICDESGNKRKVRLLNWIEGRLWSSVNPINDSLLESLGKEAGKIAQALQSYDHPAAHRKIDWDTAQAEWVKDYLQLFEGKQKEIATIFLNQFIHNKSAFNSLRKSVVHNDANDNNIIVTNELISPQVAAIIDYGDAVFTQTINDLAIAIAYAVMGKPNPLEASLAIVKGYHQSFPLEETALKYLHNLVAMRLVISVTKSAINKGKEPENKYLLISEKPAWDLLEKWIEIDSKFAYYSFREVCGFTAHPHEEAFKNWAIQHTVGLEVLFPSIQKKEIELLDLSVGSSWLGSQSEFNDLAFFQYKISRLQEEVPHKIIAGGYLESRVIYTSSDYNRNGNSGAEKRTVHIGFDFWLPAQTPVHALFEGEICTAVLDEGNKKYGGLIILKHTLNHFHFYSLYGHLSAESVHQKKVGAKVKQGERIGYLGNTEENGNWSPHLHFQIMLSMLHFEDDFPGVAYQNEAAVWRSICPDPNLFFQLPDTKKKRVDNLENILSYRKKHLGKGMSISYKKPLHIVRGSGVHLIDTKGRKYLDTVNNVAHVGHEHPRVVQAGQAQMGLLNTNTRYLNEKINEFVEILLQTFPPELSVVHLVNSGSEANELALRMVRTCTQQKDLIAMEIGYHGNTNGCIEISSYKFDGKGGNGVPPHTHIVPLPDSFRGIYQGENAGTKYAKHLQEQIEKVQSAGRNIAGFFCESIISCGGQIELPANFLAEAYQLVRNAGGLCVADEVQVGCGRVGTHFWGFEQHGVTPDIVTFGKPIGNGHPLAAVVCTEAVAEQFANGMEYFNTFGGNPVSCAIGTEVLRVIKDEKLQENALTVGNYLKAELKKLQSPFPIIGDVRGQGLFLGFELVDAQKMPLAQKAAYLSNRMRDLGILMSTDGKDNNVLKIKPPMVFSKENAEEFIFRLKQVFSEDFMQAL